MILIKYILKNHLLPFLFSTFILIAVLLLQYLVKMADRLVGKGLSVWIILQLISYSLAWIVVLVIPMSVLIATLMAFGTMSQNNEIAILKATGVSLYKMMIPPLVASVFVALALVYFNNNIYPDANHALRILLEDVSRKKPTLSLVPGVFSQEVPNYSILVRDIDQTNNELKQVTIYDYSTAPKIKVVTASTGRIYFSQIQKKLIMDLKNGEVHESDNLDRSTYRRMRFDRYKVSMHGDQFSFEQSSTLSGQRGDRELGAPQLLVIADSLKKIRTDLIENYNTKIKSLVENNNAAIALPPTFHTNQFTYLKCQQKIRADQNLMMEIINRLDYNDKETDRYWVEINKKYSLPFACIIFVLIGAPLGTMMRKGGFGMASGMSLVFFLIYWAFLIGGEKLADRGLLSPFWGIWSANFFLGIFGLIIMIKSAREKVTISFDFFNKLIPKSWRTTQEENENS
jgi:lipopolysaccharide export system permease protein